jgi:hypothetical protein
VPPIDVTLAAADPGTYFIEDDGIPGNNLSQFRRPDGSIFVFEHPTNVLNFFALAPGINLVVDLVDALGSATFRVGDVDDPTQNPDSLIIQNVETSGTVLLAANGSITEGTDTDAAADISPTDGSSRRSRSCTPTPALQSPAGAVSKRIRMHPFTTA